MPLFVCDECGYIDNTAISMCSWNRKDEDDKRPVLCSKCCPEQPKQSRVRKANRKPTEDELKNIYYWGKMRCLK